MLCLRFADGFICFFLQTLTYANTLRPQAFFVAASNRKLKSGNVYFLQSQKIVVPQPLKNVKNRCPVTPKKRQNQMLCLRFADCFICFLQTLTYANTLRPQAFFVAASNRKLKSGNVHFLQSKKKSLSRDSLKNEY